MAELQDLLLLHVGRGVERDGGAVAQAGQAIELPAQLAAEPPGIARGIILYVEIRLERRAHHRHVADQFARRVARRPQRQPHVITGQVARQQQIAFGIEAVEHRIARQPVEIAGDQRFRAASVAARTRTATSFAYST